MKKNVFLLLGMILISIPVLAQDSTIDLVGSVMDKYGAPVKGAMVFIDSVNTNIKTDKKGFYEVEIDSAAKNLTVYSKQYGLLSMDYTGQKRVSFLYKDDSKPLKKSALKSLGFNVSNRIPSNAEYENFATILEILDKRFYYAKVTNGQVKIGKGTNQFAGDSNPLVIVDGQQMPISVLTTIPTIEVESIRVIHQGSEAAEYGGLRAANGVILIALKE